MVPKPKPTFNLASLFKYLGYALSVVAAIAVINGASTSNYKAKLDRQTMMKSDSTLIREVTNLNRKVTSIEQSIEDIKENQADIYAAQNSLRSSYVLHLKDNKALTTDEFIRYMDGIQFDLKKNFTVSLPQIQSQQAK